MLPSEAMEVMKSYGVNVIGKRAKLEEILRMPRPLVLKADTEEHKTERGLVFLNLKTDSEIVEAYRKLEPYGVIAQPFVEGFELIVGGLREKTFGKVVMVGAGGVLAEIFQDVSFRAVPIERRDAEEMLAELRVKKIFEGFRGKVANRESVIETLLAVSAFAQENEFKELDINPLIVNERGAFAVDVRLIE